MWEDSFGVFADREHRGFDMDMTVEETRGDIQPAGVDDFGRFTDAGAGVADEGDAAFCDAMSRPSRISAVQTLMSLPPRMTVSADLRP